MAAPRADAPENVATAPAGAPGKPARRIRDIRFGIQSKLLIMLLLVSVGSTLAIGFLGFQWGSQALERSVFDRLTALRQSRKGQIERYFDALGNQLVVLGRDPKISQAMQDFATDFKALQNTSLTPDQQAQLQAFYQRDFAAQLDRNVSGTPAVANFEPTNNAQSYLQHYYTIGSTNSDVNAAVVDAKDGSDWSSTHRSIQPFLYDLANRLEFDDILLVDTDGNVVFTVSKGIDLGANLLSKPFDTTLLGRTFASVLGSGSVDSAVFTDYENYVPSFGVPTAFVLTPIHQDGEMFGVAVVKLPAGAVNRIMTDAGNWETDGLGQTGETYLAGADFLMRSQSRFLLQDPEAFAQQVRSAGTPEEVVDRMLSLGSTIMLQPVRSASVEAAVRGETGTIVTLDYRDIAVLGSYAPVELPNLNWVIVSKIDISEAYAPPTAFARRLLLATAAVVVIVTIASLALTQVIARPIRMLAAGARRVSAGDTSTGITIASKDELGELASAFDSLRATVQRRDEQLARHDQESQRLLQNIMPEAIAQRYMSGEQIVAQDHENVAVIAVSLDGWNMLASGLDAGRSSALLNELVRSAEEAAERIGVERARMIGTSYVATSGLLVPRVDYARRAVDYARALREILERFNSRNKAELRLRIGIDTGSVTSALIGSTTITYDIWGDPVETARLLKGHVQVEGILVSDRVYRRLREIDAFETAGTMDTPAGAQPVWSVVEGKDVPTGVPTGQLQG